MVIAYALFFFLIDIVLLFFILFFFPYLGLGVEIPAYFAPFPALLLALYPVLYFGWIEEKNRQRLEQLADRLRQLYKCAGQPALRVRRPRRLHFETHQALRELEKSLKALERHYQIRCRRLRYPRMFIDDPKPVLDNMDQRLSRLEEIDVK
ncbi:MAG: hypothetical protein OXE49_00790 [Gemmatimonadetes bacterium]|nr:hypothetical protein [Gemmatimonadota bacterium]